MSKAGQKIVKKRVRLGLAARSALFFVIFWPIIVFAAVNINTAGKGELVTLKGIGEVKAQAIIDYRDTNGSFMRIEDILNVSGIGPATFANIKTQITVGTVAPAKVEEDAKALQQPSVPAPESVKNSPSLLPYIVGLFSLIVLGVVSVVYARMGQQAATTFSAADEFEITSI